MVTSYESVNTPSFEKLRLIHRGSRFYQAECYLVRLENGALGVLKDFLRNSAVALPLLARFFARREKHAYIMTGKMAGIPSFWGAPSEHSILIEYIDAPNLRQADKAPPPSYFNALEELIRNLHQRGIAHGEIRMSNLLVTVDLAPCLIDLATASTACCTPPGPVFRLKQQIDWYCFLTIKQHILGSLSSRESRRLTSLKRLGSCIQPHVHY